MRLVAGRIMIARARGAFSAPSSELRISARAPSVRASMPATYPPRHACVAIAERVQNTKMTSTCSRSTSTIQSDDLERQRLSRERKAVRNAAAAALRRNTVAAAAVAARPSVRTKKPVHSRGHTRNP